MYTCIHTHTHVLLTQAKVNISKHITNTYNNMYKTYIPIHTHTLTGSTLSPIAPPADNSMNLAGLHVVFDPDISAACYAHTNPHQSRHPGALSTSQMPASSSQILPGGLILPNAHVSQANPPGAVVMEMDPRHTSLSLFSSHGSQSSPHKVTCFMEHKPPNMSSPKVVQVRAVPHSSKSSPKSTSGLNYAHVQMPIKSPTRSREFEPLASSMHGNPSLTYGLVAAPESPFAPAQSAAFKSTLGGTPEEIRERERERDSFARLTSYAALRDNHRASMMRDTVQQAMQDSTNKIRDSSQQHSRSVSPVQFSLGVPTHPKKSSKSGDLQPPPRKKESSTKDGHAVAAPRQQHASSSPHTTSSRRVCGEQSVATWISPGLGSSSSSVLSDVSNRRSSDRPASFSCENHRNGSIHSKPDSRMGSLKGFDPATSDDKKRQELGGPAWRDGWYHREGYKEKPRALLLL
jgi:hypothetical protein